MLDHFQVKQLLRQVYWVEGRIIPVACGPYRHQIVVHCTKEGRRTATFADGKDYKYAGYIQFVNDKGEWTQRGASIVPVLPNGDILFIVEQRPAQSRFPGRNKIALIGGKSVDLNDFGLHSSLEPPGGSIEPGQGLKAGFLAELTAETGIADQPALVYSRRKSVCLFGSDLAQEQYQHVVFLTGLVYEPYVADDGGLQVFALSEAEVDYNIHNDVICSGQAALLPWAFYKEVQRARADAVLEQKLKDMGYLAVEEIQITKAKQ